MLGSFKNYVVVGFAKDEKIIHVMEVKPEFLARNFIIPKRTLKKLTISPKFPTTEFLIS